MVASGKNESIQKLNSEIARNLTTRIDYIEVAPKKQMGRPRHGCGSESGSASSPSSKPPYKDKRVKSLSWFFHFEIPTGGRHRRIAA